MQVNILCGVWYKNVDLLQCILYTGIDNRLKCYLLRDEPQADSSKMPFTATTPSVKKQLGKARRLF